MQSRSNGKARPHLGATLIVEKVRHRAGIDDDATALEQTIAELNATQRGNSWSLPVPEGAEADAPVWHGPEHWIETARVLLATERGQQLVRAHHTNADTVVIVASGIAAHADGLTGRNVTVSDATLCDEVGFQVKTIRRARYVLRDLGLARSLATGRPLNLVEQAAAWLHHGGAQTKAASVWALMIPREAAAVTRPLTPRRKSASLGRLSRAAHAAAAAANAAPSTPDRPVGPPTTNLSSREVCPGANYSPSARERDGKKSKKSKEGKEASPRPLHLQLAAAELVHHISDLNRGHWISTPGSGSYVRLPGSHIGRIADLIADAGIDTTRWTGRAIAARLTRYVADQGYSWPNRISNPGGFLRSLLWAVDWTEQTPTMSAAAVRERRRELQRQDELEQQQRQAERARIAAQKRQEAAQKAADNAHSSGECGLCHDTGWIVAFGAGDPIAPMRCICPGLDRPALDLPAPPDPMAPASEQLVDAVSSEVEVEDQRAAELDAAAGETCLMCSSAPGTVRTSMASRPVVCDPCWHAAGFDGVPSCKDHHAAV
ncbi:hypothetical protein IU459_32955 [Nocardia amamiensis]|uniref:Uncharacterized protein n=1 Tax=Nocardia amamiensis TaxID=404578 RepID=A0ABS0D0I3_9NOCA|nr:hypothetical protein [Nocardia amamiensis]MBF6302316.1 hypothetical protein [Nocardia amamiensis]